MSWSLKESVEKQSQNPEERASLEEHLERVGDTQPVKSAYWRALRDGDVKTVDKILTAKAIFRAREKAKTDPGEARYLEHLLQHLKKLEAASSRQ